MLVAGSEDLPWMKWFKTPKRLKNPIGLLRKKQRSDRSEGEDPVAARVRKAVLQAKKGRASVLRRRKTF